MSVPLLRLSSHCLKPARGSRENRSGYPLRQYCSVLFVQYGHGSLLPQGEGQDEGKKVVVLLGFPHPHSLPKGEGILMLLTALVVTGALSCALRTVPRMR